MKKHLLCAGTFLASSFAAFAGALNTTGIPASAAGVVHIDFEAASKSKIGQTAKDALNTGILGKVAKDEATLLEDLKKELFASGITLESLADATIALIPRQKGEPEPLVIVRGKFDPAKIAAAAKKEKLKTVVIGGRTFFEKPESEKILGGEDGPTSRFQKTPSTLFCALDSGTILAATDKTAAAAALAALSGKAKSYTAPAPLPAYGKRVGTPFVLVYINGKSFPKQNPAQAKDAMDMSPPNPAHVFFALGEDTKNVKVRLAMAYANATDVQKTQSFAQMMLGMAGMFASSAGPDGKPDPKKAETAAKISKALSALKIATAEPNYFTVSFDYPVGEIVQAIKDAATKGNAASSPE
jgi:hypothetical protein